jgi:CheY-like chemotaxis protein
MPAFMANKRALIVDDSRSARVILGRMLETHGLQVDTAESGEQALDYLRDARPDVIFMDHLMPGMDGFDAVKQIKRDERTASIPIMMYTSQEGDAYVREARALGTVGVLSKTLVPADVSRVLYQLRLLPDRRDTRDHPDAAPSMPSKSNAVAAPAASTAHPWANHGRDSAAELRRYFETTLEHMAQRISNDVRSTVQTPSVGQEPIRAKVSRGVLVALLVFGLLPTLIASALLWKMFETQRAQLDQANARLAVVVAEQQNQIEALRSELRKSQSETPADTEIMGREILPVTYGEPPLSGTRIEHLRKLFDRLRAEGFKGTVRIEYFTGDFCLIGNAASGYRLANAELAQRRCDLIGSPYDDGLPPVQRQSREYTALINAVKQSSRGDIQVVTADGGRRLIMAYPPQSETLSAGDWNRIAERNHRIEITLQPKS